MSGTDTPRLHKVTVGNRPKYSITLIPGEVCEVTIEWRGPRDALTGLVNRLRELFSTADINPTLGDDKVWRMAFTVEQPLHQVALQLAEMVGRVTVAIVGAYYHYPLSDDHELVVGSYRMGDQIHTIGVRRDPALDDTAFWQAFMRRLETIYPALMRVDLAGSGARSVGVNADVPIGTDFDTVLTAITTTWSSS